MDLLTISVLFHKFCTGLATAAKMSDFSVRRTWPDEPSRSDDYVFRHNGKDVGRCYLQKSPLGERWRWTMYGSNAHGDAISLQLAQDEFKAAFKLQRGL